MRRGLIARSTAACLALAPLMGCSAITDFDYAFAPDEPGPGMMDAAAPDGGGADGGGLDDAGRPDGAPSDTGSRDASLEARAPDAATDARVDDGASPDATSPPCARDLDCDDGEACTTDRCLATGCSNEPVSCDDRVACTGDTCSGGTCIHSLDHASCVARAGGRCDATNGCQYPMCDMATCVPGPCETATCMGPTCVRSSRCGMGEMCCGDACVPVGCDDGNPCTDDACAGDLCTHVAAVDRLCDDGDACTFGDRCDGTTCVGEGLLSCDDMNDCTVDSCDRGTGCRSTPRPDGVSCTSGDRFQCCAGTCHDTASSPDCGGCGIRCGSPSCCVSRECTC